MSEQRASSDLDRDPLEALASEFVERCRAGEHPTIDEYARAHPELASDIRDLFPTILAVELAKGGTTLSRASTTIRSSPPIARLGDFRIVREIGRGGMGIVYEAVQESLARHVAIKVLPPEFAQDPNRKERFEREARTAARLHHTNIVPIFGVGEHEGRPYFVMQYIAGTGLDAVFRELARQRANAPSAGEATHDPFTTSASLLQAARRSMQDSEKTHARIESRSTESRPSSFTPSPAAKLTPPSSPSAARANERRGGYWASVASLMAQAADALHFAHSQGVLHRDVKPSNLLLDADGVLWVTDFGLAKALEHDDLTQAGDVIGTLRYLAPEQFEGRSNARSDIYSLGVTAFELATLTPAFAPAGRSSLMHAIMQGTPLRPRERCLGVPPDLETILLKATSRSPADRYLSAAGFRDDLQRFAEDLPILARRSTSWERARRWARRNPALAATTGITFALLLTTAVVSSAAFWTVQRANERETRQRERAEATSELAVDALDTVLNELAPDEFRAAREFSLDESDETAIPVVVPTVVTPQTANLLGHLLAFYERLAAQHGDSDRLQLKAAAANRRVAEIYELLGRYADSDAACRAAIDIYERTLAGGEAPEETTVLLAQTRNQLGGLLAAQDQMLEAQLEFDNAATVLEPLMEDARASAGTKFELARSYYLAARRGMLRLPPEAAQPAGPPPGERRGAPGPPGPGSPEADRRAAAPGGRNPLAFNDQPTDSPRGPGPIRRRVRQGPGPEGEPGRRREHLMELDRAIDLLANLSAQAPDEPKYLHLSALCLREREAMRSGPAAPPELEGVVTRLQQLADRFPGIARYRFDLAETLVMQDRGPRAVERLNQALAILQTLADERPEVPAYRFALGHAHLRLSRAYEESGYADAALSQARQALAIHQELAHLHTDAPAFALTTAMCESVLAGLLQRGGNLEEAKQLLLSATARLEKLNVANDPRPHIRSFAARCFDQLSRVYHQLGDHAHAREALDTARFLGPGPGPRFGP